jgi:hypothetical protein
MTMPACLPCLYTHVPILPYSPARSCHSFHRYEMQIAPTKSQFLYKNRLGRAQISVRPSTGRTEEARTT